MIMQLLLAFVFLLTWSGSSFAASPTSDLPPLHRGVNLACWLANANGRQVFYPRDFKRIKQEGFDFVRLPVNPEVFGFSFGDDSKINTAPIEQALSDITHAGLAVVLDIHPLPPAMEKLESSDEAETRFIALWEILTRSAAQFSSSQLVFELLNEPHYYHDSARYTKLVKRTIAHIRAIDPNRLIIVESPGVTSLYPVDSLARLDLIDDPRVAYDVHFYQPYIVTHQGVNKGFEKTQMRYFLNVPYPSDRVDLNNIQLAPGADADAAKKQIDAYVKEGWSRDRVMSYLAPAAAWAREHHVRLLVLEYGVIKNGWARHDGDSDTRYRWIGSVTGVLDTLSTGETPYIGRALWDESDNFGIDDLMGETQTDPVDGSVRFLNPETGIRRIQPAASKALGLTPEKLRGDQ